MIKSMKHLDNYDRSIIHFLYNTGDSNLNQIAEKVGMSWQTAHIHLIKLHRIGYVRKYKEGKIIYFRLVD